MSRSGGEDDESGGDGAGDGGDGGRDPMQVEPKSAGAGRNALNDAGGEGRQKSGGEDGDGDRQSRRSVKAAEQAGGANEQEEADKGKEFVDNGERHLEGFARDSHQKTRDENGAEEPGDVYELLHGQVRISFPVD